MLTKRSQRLRDLLNTKLRFAAEQPHIWWGVSVEDKKYGLPRIEDLRNTRARVRFLSVEPLLEDLGKVNLRGVDWMIVGGESGAGARPMKKEWGFAASGSVPARWDSFLFQTMGRCSQGIYWKAFAGRTYDEFPTRVRNPVMSVADSAVAAEEIKARWTSPDVFPVSLLKGQEVCF